MNVYRVDMLVCATAYIKATSEAEALKMARALDGQCPAILDSGGDVAVSGLNYNDPALPDISLSPAMTIHETWNDAEPELIEEGVPDKIDEGTAEAAAISESWRLASAGELAAGFWRFQNDAEGTQSEAPTWADLCRQQGISLA